MEKPLSASLLPHHLPEKRQPSSAPTSWRRVLSAVIAGALVVWYSLTWLLNSSATSSSCLDNRVEEVLRLQPLTDGHNDFPIFIRAFYHNHIYQSNFSDRISLPGQVDFPRLAEGRLRGQFWSVYIGCSDSAPEPNLEYVRDTLQQIDLVHRLAAAYPEHLELVSNTPSFLHTFRTSRTKIASFIGVEGLHQIGSSASILRLYHTLGVRYVTLTHVCHNEYADSATPSAPRHHGLSVAGRAMIHEMNRLGMAVDLAHVSVDTMYDALDTSHAPVMFSHSSTYALCPNPRNVPDEVLLRLKENDGVIMITFFPEYTRCGTGKDDRDRDPSDATLSDVADHIQHVGELIGYRHVGLGSDFDGMENTVRGLEDVSRYPDLIRDLLSRGVSVGDVSGVIGGNVLRVMAAVERVAREMVADGVLPLEDDVEDLIGLSGLI